MADLKVALENVREESTSGRQALQARRRWAWAVWPLAILVVVLLGLFAWQSWRAPENTEPLRAVPLTTQPGVHGYPSFSPDANHVAFTWTGSKQGNRDIYVQQIGSGAPLQLTHDPGNDYNPVWSPDGKWIAFLRSQSEAGKSELRLIPARAQGGRNPGARRDHGHSAVPCLVSGQRLFGRDGLAGRGQTGRLVRDFA